VIHGIKQITPPSVPPLQGEGSYNVIKNYYRSPDYVKKLMVDLRKNQTKTE